MSHLKRGAHQALMYICNTKEAAYAFTTLGSPVYSFFEKHHVRIIRCG